MTPHTTRTDPTPSKEAAIHALYEAVQPIACWVDGLELIYGLEGHPKGNRLVLTISGRKPLYVNDTYYVTTHNRKDPDWSLISDIREDIEARKKGEPKPGVPFTKPQDTAAGKVERAAHRTGATAPPPLPDTIYGARVWVWIPRLKDYRPGTINRLNPDGTVGVHLHLRSGGDDPKIKQEAFVEVRLFDPDDKTPRAGRWAVLATVCCEPDCAGYIEALEIDNADIRTELGRLADTVDALRAEAAKPKSPTKAK